MSCGRIGGFVDAVFTHGPDLHHGSPMRRADYADYAERVVRGGFPESLITVVYLLGPR